MRVGELVNLDIADIDFTKAIAAEKLTGKVTVSGEAKVGAVLSAGVQDSNNSGTLSYRGWQTEKQSRVQTERTIH